MGLDPAHGHTSPAVFIDGEEFYYGQEPEYGQFMVSHHADGKRYWCFDTEEEMIEFLDNLPESSRPLTINGAPIWFSHGLVPQDEFDRLFDEHQRYIRLLLQTRRRNGLAFRYRQTDER